ncbi:MAG: hypothetical protein PF541_18750 [Prolixibacteraceae bacterium]|jgi:hypothetical protein|nr:hypothetical protein [Prolixibacteraceae bacterium]
MELNQVIDILNAKVVAGNASNFSVEKGFCSDLMSDVLTVDTDKMLLITGMSNLQTIRTSEMADIHCIALVRNKKATIEMKGLAMELGITLIETSFSMYRAVGELYASGLQPVY